MKLEGQNIIIVSNEPWDGMWFSKHHYARELSKKNKLVFVEPPVDWAPSHLFRSKATLKEVLPSLHLLSYRNALPFSVRSSFFHKINNLIISIRIRNFLQKNGFNKPILWSFDPFRITKPSLLAPAYSIYHCMDDYHCQTEASLAGKVDLIITVSSLLTKKLQPFSENIMVVPHGIPSSEIKASVEVIKNQFIFGGSIDGRTDFELLNVLADEFPDTTILMMGETKEEEFSKSDVSLFQKLKKHSNVIFTGAQSFENFIQQVSQSKLCLCLYKQNNRANHLSSLKIMQYLSMGRPVITTYMEEFDKEELRPLLSMIKSKNDFLQLVREELNKDSSEWMEKRKALASNYTYEGILQNIEHRINSTNSDRK